MSAPQAGQSLNRATHMPQYLCPQLVTTQSYSSDLQIMQCSVLSLGPEEEPKPRGQTAGAGGAGAAEAPPSPLRREAALP